MSQRGIVVAFLRISVLCVCFGVGVTAQGMDPEILRGVVTNARGFAVLVDVDLDTQQRLLQAPRLLVHCLDRSEASITKGQDLLQSMRENGTREDGNITSSVLFEHWTQSRLPHASNIANLIVLGEKSSIPKDEVMRILRPGGQALFEGQETTSVLTKPKPADTDDWTHQWHAADGGLSTKDQQIKVPQGVQWLAGPLFAMAGRKSSTQTLVSAGGINFYVTQNVLENVGQSVMEQYLVARDAFNGLVLWQKRWTGPFVTGNGETNPRLIASEKLLYGVGDSRLFALDPWSGTTVASVSVDQVVDKIVLANGSLLAQCKEKIIAYKQDLSEIRWQIDGKQLSGMTISDGLGYLLSSGRSPDGRFKHELVCLNLNDGAEVWRVNTQPDVTAAQVRINFVQDGFIALQSHGFLHVYSCQSGKHLWTKTTDARPGKTYVDERYVGHFYRDGLVWMLAENSPRESEGQNTWLGLNVQSGELVRELTTQGTWPRTATPAKMGCQVLIASDRYIMIPRQATFVDFETGEKHSFKFTRGGCGLGFVPANGLVYSHPHACGCFSEAIRGFMGMHGETFGSAGQPSDSGAEPIERLAFQFSPELSDSTEQSGWSTYRGNGVRGAYASTTLGDSIKESWSFPIATSVNDPAGLAWDLRTGNRISASTISDNRVFAADVNGGRLFAFDIATGKELWTYQSAGRIDSPPTIWSGLCIFGSHDGYVTCLEASTGRICWKFRAAPFERRIIAFGSLESNWPVAGGVLVRDGIVYAAAGRAPDADGGIEVVALDARSGKLAWTDRIRGGAFTGLSDYLIDGDKLVYLSNQAFDPATGAKAESVGSGHLRGGKVGLLESSWTKHDLALRKEIQTWRAQGLAGQLLAFSPHHGLTYEAESRHVHIHGDENHEFDLAAPEQVTALALTDSHALIAGGKDRRSALSGGFLRLVSLETGEVTDSIELSAEASFDTVAVAKDRILVSTQDGYLHCFTVEEENGR